jgi:hypothetical protein
MPAMSFLPPDHTLRDTRRRFAFPALQMRIGRDT